MKPVLIIVITVVVIGVMFPNIFAETVSNNFGLFHLDESTYEIPTSADSTNLVKVYGTVETIVKGDRGNILFTTPDGTTDGSSFLVTKDGNFESFFILNKNSQIGDYSVFVSYGPHPIGTLHFSVSEKVYNSQDISVARNEFDQIESEDRAAQQRAAEREKLESRIAEAEQRIAEAEQRAEQRAAEQRAAEQRAAEQRAAEQRAAEQRAAEQRAAEQRAAEQRAAEQRAAEQRAEAAIRAAEAKAAQDLTNFLIIGGIAIMIISLVVILAKRKNKKSTTPQRSTTSTSPPPSPSGNTETSTMFFYECPKCHSGDIKNNPDGSVNCPDCGYRG